MARRAGTVVALIVAALALPHAIASQVSGEVRGPGWMLFDYVGGAENAWIKVRAELHGPGVVMVDQRYDRPEGELLSGSSVRAAWFGGGAETSAGPAKIVAPGTTFAISAIKNLPPGESGRVLLWSMSHADAWSWNATLPPGTSLTLVDSGHGGYFWTGAEYEQGVHAHARANSISASSSLDARYGFDVANTFVGVAGLQPDGQTLNDRVNVTRPDGTVMTCECHPLPWADWGPGNYEIGWTGPSVGLPTILLAGVDVPGHPLYNWPS